MAIVMRADVHRVIHIDLLLLKFRCGFAASRALVQRAISRFWKYAKKQGTFPINGESKMKQIMQINAI